jgi:hypothetical protein
MKRLFVLDLAAVFGVGASLLLLPPMIAEAQVIHSGGLREVRLAGACLSIDDGESVSLPIGDARIRRGGTARVTGVRQSIYVEAGGTAEVLGTSGFVYVAKGGKATVGGVRNQIIAEAGGDVSLIGAARMTVVDWIEVHVHPKSAACR